jgi:HK97 family phage major capsid protein
MTERLAELRAKHAEKIEALVAINQKMSADDYVPDKTHELAFAELEKETADLKAKIDQTEKVASYKLSISKPHDTNGSGNRVFAQPRKRYAKLKAFRGEDAEENAYKCGKWVKGFVFGNSDARQWCHDNGVIDDDVVTKAESEGINTAGGFLVPTPMLNAIIDLREQFGVFRANAQIVPMSSDTLAWPRRTGGLTANFISEGTAVTESTASWDNVNLVAKKLAALTRISTELSEDALMSVADLMTAEIAYAFVSKEDDCGFNGDGSSTFGGIRGLTNLLIDGNHNAGKVAAASGHPTFALLDNTDLTKLIGTLPQYALAQAKFYCSALAFGTCFERLIATAGGNSISTLDGSIQYRYLGFPIVISQKLPVISTTLNGLVMILFGNLAMAAAMGERRIATIRRSEERYFELDQIGILGTERIDIVNHDLGDNTNAGPIVGLVGTT